jgi:hypothetical protein
METNVRQKAFGKDQEHRQASLYLVVLFILMFGFPLLSVFLEYRMRRTPLDPGLIGKWFVFWSIGVRLFIAGIGQIAMPGIAVLRIFHATEEKGPGIRELGLANISMGIMGMVSLVYDEWRPLAAITGGIFFGLAGLRHLFRKPGNFHDIAAMVTHQLIAVIMMMYVFFSLLR